MNDKPGVDAIGATLEEDNCRTTRSSGRIRPAPRATQCVGSQAA